MADFTTLKHRSQFLRANQSKFKFIGRLVVIQAHQAVKTPTQALPSLQFGLTVSKKIGNAVTRNRVKRQLKHALMQLDAGNINQCYYYVIIARAKITATDFQAIISELNHGLKWLKHKLPATNHAQTL